MLDNLGCVIVGAAATVEQALAMVKSAIVIDAAILDVNIGGWMGFPVAHLLLECDVPSHML